MRKENTILFTSDSLKNCHEKKAIRDKESKRKSKYDAIVLSESPDSISGYHPTCYRYFTSIRSKKQTEVPQIEGNITFILLCLAFIYFALIFSIVIAMPSDCVQLVDEVSTLVSTVLTPSDSKGKTNMNKIHT